MSHTGKEGVEGLPSQPCGLEPSARSSGLHAEPSAAERIIYVVVGSTGEYSDRTEWLTRAFESGDEAEAFVEFLGQERQKLPPNDSWQAGRDIEAAMRRHDPGFQEDYTGTRWHVEPVVLSQAEGR